MREETTIALHDASKVDLSHLSIQHEGDEYTIGDPTIQRFIRVPEAATFVLALANGSRTLAEIKDQIHREKGLDLDVLDFVQTLHRLRLVYSIDGKVMGEPRQNQEQTKMRRVGGWLFNRYTAWLYAFNACLACYMMLANPEMFPHYRDMFVFQQIGLNSLYVCVIACLLVALHEFAHFLAASSAGVRSTFRLNMRYIFLVAETDMTGLWGQPRSKRYLPYLAGMAWDSTWIVGMLLLQSNVPVDSLLHATAKLVTLLLVLGTLSQFMFFLRTDMYFVIGNLTHSADLAQSGRLFLKRIWKRNDEALAVLWNRLPETEKKAGRVFGFFYAIGIVCVTYLFLFFTIPGLFTSLSWAIREVSQYRIDQMLFWDGAIILGLFVVRMLLKLIGARNAFKDWLQKRAQQQGQG
ncbi:MAG TPA: hypothetical protein VE710_01445 [Candidatus Bathyarchaeia archaeon]|nr:hypothetical protein [Candidatus Bathyarchaeia archaeon]